MLMSQAREESLYYVFFFFFPTLTAARFAVYSASQASLPIEDFRNAQDQDNRGVCNNKKWAVYHHQHNKIFLKL